MHRTKLITQLLNYQPRCKQQRDCVNKIIKFVSEQSNCFERENNYGHITGSAWLLDHTKKKALLTHHRKLKLWCQLGGHADGENDILNVALREAKEESGIEDITPLSDKIFDIDIHWIPENKGVAGHYHFDIRYLLQVTQPADFVVSDESFELAWVPLKDYTELQFDDSVMRLFRKSLAG